MVVMGPSSGPCSHTHIPCPQTHAHPCIDMFLTKHACTPTQTHRFLLTGTCLSTCTMAPVPTHIHTHTHTHTHMHTHTHEDTGPCFCFRIQIHPYRYPHLCSPIHTHLQRPTCPLFLHMHTHRNTLAPGPTHMLLPTEVPACTHMHRHKPLIPHIHTPIQTHKPLFPHACIPTKTHALFLESSEAPDRA
jgi:hypothetical protein